jgi:hypothetical protein
MSGLKELYTKIFLEQAGFPTDDDSVRQYIKKWFRNPREKLDSSLTLTDEGFEFLTTKINLKSYRIQFPKDFQMTTQVVLFLDKFLDCPNYYNKKEIYVFKEKKAAELMLFSGDVRKYGIAKALARQRELEE